jgi:hypothetical protein
MNLTEASGWPRLLCAGANDPGQIGTGNTTVQELPQQVTS